MFPRALKRTFHHDTYTQITPNIDLLTLPFLCPALFWKPKRLFTSSATVRPSSNSHSSPSRPDLIKQPAVSALSCHRSLASAAEAHTEAQHDSYIPFDRYTKYESFNSQPVYNGQGTASLTDIDPNLSPLVIVDGVTTHPAKFRVKDSVSGDLNDIHQNLSACLEVGRFERAAALLRRLNEIYKPDAPGLLVAHNNYVNELAAKIVRTRDQQLLNDLQRWFKVDLLDVGVLPNAQIYARMIQASSQTSDLKVKDMIMTYLALAKEAGIGDEVKHLVAELEGEEIVCLFSAQSIEDVD